VSSGGPSRLVVDWRTMNEQKERERAFFSLDEKMLRVI